LRLSTYKYFLFLTSHSNFSKAFEFVFDFLIIFTLKIKEKKEKI